jgi:hypothetical protein
MNAAATPHFSTPHDLPESIAADRYGKISAPEALKMWLKDFSELIASNDDTTHIETQDKMTCLKEGLKIITERAWTKGELQHIEAWWKPDDCIENCRSWIENLNRSAQNDKNSQLIRDLKKITELLRYRFHVSEGKNYRAL